MNFIGHSPRSGIQTSWRKDPGAKRKKGATPTTVPQEIFLSHHGIGGLWGRPQNARNRFNMESGTDNSNHIERARNCHRCLRIVKRVLPSV